MIRANPMLTSTEVGFKLVPHELSEKDLIDRISMFSSNLARYKREQFLDALVTGDEKWIVYKHVVRKR
ncbi:hypothetical protein TNCV_2477191 [Trichonephila clavipes]|nr:hypothetical protein TNCV_2477191 [Trichonephila clavipes]